MTGQMGPGAAEIARAEAAIASIQRAVESIRQALRLTANQPEPLVADLADIAVQAESLAAEYQHWVVRPTSPRAADPRDPESMAISAIRYTIGRRSYITIDGQRWAREWGARSPWVRDVIRRDLREACDRAGALGDPGDEAGWRNVLTDLDVMAERADAE